VFWRRFDEVFVEREWKYAYFKDTRLWPSTNRAVLVALLFGLNKHSIFLMD
jgi:hypothetical protein